MTVTELANLFQQHTDQSPVACEEIAWGIIKRLMLGVTPGQTGGT